MEIYVRSNNGRVHPGIETAVVDGLRGVYANQPIKKHEEILFVPNDLIIFQSSAKPERCMSEMAIKLSKKDPRFKPYFDHLPLDVKQFPAAWKKGVDHPTLNAIVQIRRVRMYEEWKSLKPSLTFDEYVYWRTMVGSRNFAKSQHELGMVPFADLLNASATPNVDWLYNADGFKMITTRYIDTGDQLFDNYGVKSSIEWLIYYGCCPKHEIAHVDRITYLLGSLTNKRLGNLTPPESSKDPMFEFCIEQEFGDGCSEMMSLMRFLVSNKPSDECPRKLNGYSFKPTNKHMEIQALHAFATFLKPPNVDDTSVKSYRDFINLEKEIIEHNIKRIDEAVLILMKNSYKDAKKAIERSKFLGEYKSILKDICKTTTYE